jgi:hypothetical protein
MSKGAAKKGNKKYSFKSIKNGRCIRVRRQAPHMAGQVRAAWRLLGEGCVQVYILCNTAPHACGRLHQEQGHSYCCGALCDC